MEGYLVSLHIINQIMKKVFLIIVFASCFSFLGNQLSGATTPTEIEKRYQVSKDTMIVVRESFGADCKLYGDMILLENDKRKSRHNNPDSVVKEKITDQRSYVRYGGDKDRLFHNAMKSANSEQETYKSYVYRDNTKGIIINLQYDSIPETGLELMFYGATYDSILQYKKKPDGQIKKDEKGRIIWCSSEWYKDINKKYRVSITKQAVANPIIASAAITNPIDTPINLPINPHQDDTHCFTKSVGFILIVFVSIIVCLIIVIFVRINNLNKKVNHIRDNQKQSPRKSNEVNVDQIKLAIMQKIQSTDLAQRISNEDIYKVVNKPDIQSYIQSIIASKIEEYLRDKVNISALQDIKNSVQQKVQSELKTDKVEYRADNNCFIISEQSQNKIFEIYSVNGEYYYTIVNDPSIRKEMLGFITAFSGCVETIATTSIPSVIEVIRDGHLIKNGEMYFVDTNYMLQVSFK